MKMILLLLILSPFTYTMQPHLHSPKPHRLHQLYAQRLSSQLPMDLIGRPDTPRPRGSTPPKLDYAMQMSPFSPEALHAEESKANAVVVRALSKKKIACLVATSAIISAILTATVTLTIHFTECKK